MMEEAEDGDTFSMLVDDKMSARRRSSGGFSPPPDVLPEPSNAFVSLDIHGEDDSLGSVYEGGDNRGQYGGSLGNRSRLLGDEVRSLLLMDERENIQLKSADYFCKKLGAPANSKIKVVSIFGNTGDGKSHTMNHAFFRGMEVFKTSAEPNTCTMGIWASFHRSSNVLCLDTEGLLGETTNENRQMRMLLKVLAISDIIIYRTRSERLRTDMFKFLGTASKAFTKYFSAALQAVAPLGTPQSLGPAVIIFHETQNTEVLKGDDEKKEEDILRDRFAKSQLDYTAFSSLRYVGIRTTKPPTNYEPLKMALEKELLNTTVRSPREPKVVFGALQAMNQKFNGELSTLPNNSFPEQYFTCTTFCKSCEVRCQLSMGHLDGKEDHRYAEGCKYQHQYENKVYLCNKCNINGRRTVVTIKTQTSNDSSWLGLAKYAWSGSVIECPNCGEIYRSRQHWYGNRSPEQNAVRTEIAHVWNDGGLQQCGPSHSAQLVLDGVAYITDVVARAGAQPTETIKSWVTDKIRPAYWEPDSNIIHCKACIINFERTQLKKHHCRKCGQGFCSKCSKHKMNVPSRGWDYPVRVCNGCRDELLNAQNQGTTANLNGGETQAMATPSSEAGQDKTSSADNNNVGDANVLARKYGEGVITIFSNIATVLEYPKDLIKDSARPSYWVPDAEAPRCNICQLVFGCPEELNRTTPLAQARPTLNGKQYGLRHQQQTGSTVSNGSPSRSSGPPGNNSATQAIVMPYNQAIDWRRHHCRACGNAVCADCSEHRRPVPDRGWLSDVRVCNNCFSSAN